MRGRTDGGGAGTFPFPLATIGIVGGGQLGRMMIYRAKKLGMRVAVLDSSDAAPAAALADRFIKGDLYDGDAILRLAEGCDVVTCEIEHLDASALHLLERSGVAVHPASRVFAVIQDKYEQKRLLAAAGVPVPRFELLPEEAPATELAGAIRRFGIPCVQKLRTGGYDGRGVMELQTEEDVARRLPGASMVEERVSIARELAVIVACGRDGGTATYPVVDMRFRPGANVLDTLEAPAQLDAETARRSVETAVKAADALGGFGIFAVELFVTEVGEVLVNEIAPRPHNSGHFTIEACVTDQFEQHLRAICGLPLGSTRQLNPAITINLLGEEGSRGRPVVRGLGNALRLPGVSFHWYGKSAVHPGRKMGHVTVLAESLAKARATAAEVSRLIRVEGE
ncbi:5-(carboxyamino)imidazole ribonucleotide synthase [Salinispira pacifica]